MNLIYRYIATIFAITLTLSTANSSTDSRGVVADSHSLLKYQDISKDVHFGHRHAQRSADDIDIIVIHSCHYANVDSFSTEGCIKQFRKHRVAPHYLISRDGTVIKMVDESDIALHAGRSTLPGTQRTQLNKSSIGIEIINTRHTGPTYLQYHALRQLVKDICSRYAIRYVVRHSDIAPGRKDDPWCFNWQRFQYDVHQSMTYLQFPTSEPTLLAHHKH